MSAEISQILKDTNGLEKMSRTMDDLIQEMSDFGDQLKYRYAREDYEKYYGPGSFEGSQIATHLRKQRKQKKMASERSYSPDAVLERIEANKKTKEQQLAEKLAESKKRVKESFINKLESIGTRPRITMSCDEMKMSLKDLKDCVDAILPEFNTEKSKTEFVALPPVRHPRKAIRVEIQPKKKPEPKKAEAEAKETNYWGMDPKKTVFMVETEK